ncbi:MAG TPA: hypothetical protein PLG94_15825 [Smithellaceae bacterium]|nr:hypothetical protein [Smithellaceae bacterium]
MSDIILTQLEADALIEMEKLRVDDSLYDYPSLGGSVTIPLISLDKREKFILDMSRGKIDLLKGTYQNRSRQVIILVRLDFGGRPHRNPDDQEIPSPHLHLYKEKYGDKWAIPVPSHHFPNVSDLWQLLHDFMKFCNITDPPLIKKGLFT